MAALAIALLASLATLLATALLKQMKMLIDLLEKAETLSVIVCDTTKYVVAADVTLKYQNPEQFYVTCLSYLLRNCATKVIFHVEDVNQLISEVK